MRWLILPDIHDKIRRANQRAVGRNCQLKIFQTIGTACRQTPASREPRGQIWMNTRYA